MTGDHQKLRRLDELAAAVCDGVIDDSGQSELRELVKQSPTLRRRYVLYMQLHAMAESESELHKPVDPAPDRESAQAPHPIQAALKGVIRFLARPTPFSLTAAAVFIGLLITAMAFVAAPIYRHLAGTDEQQVSSPVVVARLTNVQNPVWAEAQVGAHLGAHLIAGHLMRLEQGFAEVTFDNGAVVLLEGPAEFDLLADGAGKLHRGKATGHVSQHPQRLEIDTDAARVVDLGTKFGVAVDEEGVVDIYVLEGKVEVRRSAPAAQIIVLTEGQAWGSREPESRDADTEAEALREQFVWAVESPAVVQFEEWTAFREALARRDDLVAYYDFQRDPTAPARLANRAASGAARDGKIVDARWAPGRWPDKHALSFTAKTARVSVDIPNDQSTLTVAAWIRLDRLGAMHGILLSDNWLERGQLHWDVSSDGVLEIAIKEVSEHTNSSSRVDAGRWTHVAAVIDTDAGFVAQYIDGKLAGQTEIEPGAPIQLGPATIGNWRSQRNMQGRMDELMIFNTALSAQEVSQIYQQGF